MSEPVAIAIGLDGVVMVLESGIARVQAFDIHGNSVKYFQDKSSSALPLNARIRQAHRKPGPERIRPQLRADPRRGWET